MSDPFRSEVEPLREKLRRAEERIAELTEDKAKLERVSAGRDPSPRILAMTIAFSMMIVALVIGVACGIFSHGATTRSEETTRALSRDVETERMKAESCKDDLVSERASHARCTATLRGDDAPAHAQAAPSDAARCACPPGDPLCTCAPALFDRAAAADALAGVHRALEGCLVPARQLGIHATVTFAASGIPAVAMIDQLGDEAKLTPTEKGCITKELFHVKVPPFTSNRAISVGKTYTFTSPAAPR